MVKLVTTLLNLLVILALQIFPGNVSVKLDVPSQVQAGSEFDVTITLNKGDLEGFSRFQQTIPAGLTAVAGTSSNADFTFTDRRVRLIWLRTPKPDEIIVTYRVKIDERLKGTFMLDGKFSYIENNERKSVDINPVAITITPSPTVDPSLIVDVNDFEKMTMPYPGATVEGAANITCIRQTPIAGGQGDFIVKVLVSKESTRRFAKIEEDVPPGYTAVAVDARDAIFTFKDQKVKFLWMNLPLEPFFTVTYRLIPKNQATLPQPVIKGAFSYLVDDEEKPAEPVAEAVKPAEKQVVTAKEPAKDTKKPGATVKTDAALVLVPEQGVYYRIQLAAGHKPVNVEQYFRKVKLDREIRQEEHNGWKKYSVGSFSLYREARDYRVHIWNTTPVKDAFITAYNSGQRITVQEALMITEQRWYQ
ncbi:MAG: hypothetical protein H6Q21_2785 [Bacteroidetes bacterium]|nr:hypothetical protein [Bacteroidota bacterium]